jgi:DNA-binding LytR/AlgR family response regulator
MKWGDIMINIAICDDEQIYLDKIYSYVNSFFSQNNIISSIYMYKNGTDLLRDCNKKIFDILFLDIDMPEVSGIEIANEIRKFNSDIILIFCTNIDSFVFQTIKFSPYRFVRKSNLISEIQELLDSLQKKIAKESVYFIANKNDIPIKLKVTEIIYFESFRHCIDIHYKNDILKTSITLDNLETDYGELGFIRIHKSYLVNYRYIYDLDVGNKSIILDDKNQLTISRYRINSVTKLYMKFTGGDIK